MNFSSAFAMPRGLPPENAAGSLDSTAQAAQWQIRGRKMDGRIKTTSMTQCVLSDPVITVYSFMLGARKACRVCLCSAYT